MDRSHVERNDDARTRLRDLVARLGDDGLAEPLADGWTVGAMLAYLAFWDRIVLARWQRRLQGGGPVVSLDDDLLDLINTAALEQWQSVPAATAARQAVAAAEAVDGAIAGLAPEVVAEVRAQGLERMLDRSGHRREHLDEIERALAG